MSWLPVSLRHPLNFILQYNGLLWYTEIFPLFSMLYLILSIEKGLLKQQQKERGWGQLGKKKESWTDTVVYLAEQTKRLLKKNTKPAVSFFLSSRLPFPPLPCPIKIGPSLKYFSLRRMANFRKGCANIMHSLSRVKSSSVNRHEYSIVMKSTLQNSRKLWRAVSLSSPWRSPLLPPLFLICLLCFHDTKQKVYTIVYCVVLCHI